MKKLFEEPELQVVKYQIYDVITSSGELEEDETDIVRPRSGWGG